MWGVSRSLNPSLGPNSTATRRALGGPTLSCLDDFFPGHTIVPNLTARQNISSGRIWAEYSGAADDGSVSRLILESYAHPHQNVLVTNVTWAPGYGRVKASSRVPSNATMQLSLWTYRSMLTDHGPFPPGQSSPAVLPVTSETVQAADGISLAITRSAVENITASPKAVVAALVATVHDVSHGCAVVPGSASSEQATAAESVAEATIRISIAMGERQSFSVVTALADNSRSGKPAPSLVQEAATLSTATDAKEVAAATTASWRAFWAKSGVSLPTQPRIEALWRGSLYMLASAASPTVSSESPPPGLFGPWVTTDQAGWNGDYTLDYNYEASFYGVYACGHPELASLYWAPMVQGMAAARRGAISRAAAHNLTGSEATALHYNAHIGPWGAGDLDEEWEAGAGQHMMWNGVFGALLFINDWEYMGANRSTFFTHTTLPLLEGLMDWWACYLTKKPLPNGGYVYVDGYDAVNEGSHVVNSQIGLSFVARLADVLRRLPDGVSRLTPVADDIATHLSPFNTATCIGPDMQPEVVWTTSANQCKH